ncbi:MAG: hypothetical protein CL814_03040 [Confluentimicrobium sp.]|uniref:Calx-beta domain-containing protein n=1 Tax=Actibacterium sp. TaxID=1872125 RepID=UPI000C39C955|nr:Calx-beta domain-containing protein [Actibacterium sp.]MBC55890.1 hypothetical protein [Actibacterium sp.]
MVEVSLNPSSGTEANDGHFELQLSAATNVDVTVTLRLIGQTADLASDADFNYYSTFETVKNYTIPAGQTSVDVYVSHHDSIAGELDENYVVEVTDPVNATLAGGSDVIRTTGVIEESGVSLFVSDPTIEEGDGGTSHAVFEVQLSRPAATDLWLDYTTVDGTAQAGSDYTAKSGTLKFVSGQTYATVRVPVKGDTRIEQFEDFSLVVTPGKNSDGKIDNGVADSTGIAIIRDDDTDTNLPVLSMEPGAGSEGEDGYYAIRLSEPSLVDVQVTLRLVGQTADLATDADFNYYSTFETLKTYTIPAGQTTVYAYVSHHDNTAGEVDENYIIEVTDPVNAVLAGGVSKIKVTGIIEEGGRAVFVGDPEIVEGTGGDTEAIFEIRLSEPADTVMQFDYLTLNGSAVARKDYKKASGTVEFLPGQTVAYVRVPVFGDDKFEANESFSLKISPTVATAALVAGGTDDTIGNALIMNDDLPITKIFGSNKKDTLVGDIGREIISGKGGADKLFGDAGDDDLRGGAGSDTLNGGVGADILNGGAGTDFADYSLSTVGVIVKLGKSVFRQGDAEGDTAIEIEGVIGSEIDDILAGSKGANTLDGLDGDDSLSGLGGNDILLGRTGNDKLIGGSGNDVLKGGGQKDTLKGNGGNDTLAGGKGVDTLTGGKGADTFVFMKKEGTDFITDFSVDEDILQLDTRLWTGTLTADEVVDQFASIVGPDTILDFGRKGTIALDGVLDLELLADTIDFI